MADTPALPGETPDPSAASALDALLREVDKNSRVSMDHTLTCAVPDWVSAAISQFYAAPRLAAIVRVLVEALSAIEGSRGEVPEYYTSVTALARAEAIAKGEA